jgi:GTPase SAR1 family protein
MIFGESGVGKSSIVNMLAGQEVFKVDGGSQGTTFHHEGCALRVGDLRLNIWDTAGLNESDNGRVSPEEAFQQLFHLFRDLGGVNLLIFVTRFRITRNTVENYHLMQDVLSGEGVPVVAAITGREWETNDEWWEMNKENFLRDGMKFAGHAIGTANRHMDFHPTYAELRAGLQDKIQIYASQKKPHLLPDAKPSDNIFRRFEDAVTKAFRRFVKIFGKPKEVLLKSFGDVLKKNGMSDEEAARSIQRVREKVT